MAGRERITTKIQTETVPLFSAAVGVPATSLGKENRGHQREYKNLKSQNEFKLGREEKPAQRISRRLTPGNDLAGIAIHLTKINFVPSVFPLCALC